MLLSPLKGMPETCVRTYCTKIDWQMHKRKADRVSQAMARIDKNRGKAAFRNYSASERPAASQRPLPTHSSKERQVRGEKPGRYHSMRSGAETRTSGSDSFRLSDTGRNPLRSSAFFVQRAKASSAASIRTAGASSCLLRNSPVFRSKNRPPRPK